MAGVDWFPADEEVIDMAQEIIEEHHTDLKGARIGFIMRAEAPLAGLRKVMGDVRKVSAVEKVFVPYDFIIWLSDDIWRTLAGSQKKALLDHELCHCSWDMATRTAKIRPHDLEEFSIILRRHGYWWPHSYEVGEIAQQATLWEEDEIGQVEVPTDMLSGIN